MECIRAGVHSVVPRLACNVIACQLGLSRKGRLPFFCDSLNTHLALHEKASRLIGTRCAWRVCSHVSTNQELYHHKKKTFRKDRNPQLFGRVLSAFVYRIMSVGPRPFPQGRRNEDGSDPRATMTYEDYVYFMLSEEDRGNEHSLRYWFACVDLDGDGRIGHMEMRLFYDRQVIAMICHRNTRNQISDT